MPGGVCVAVDSVGDVVSYPDGTYRRPDPDRAGYGENFFFFFWTRPTATQVRKSLVSLLRFAPTKRSIAALLRHRKRDVDVEGPLCG